MQEVNCEIACPGYKRWVKGYYDKDPQGRYLVGENGQPSATRTLCYNEGNACTFRACVLHRSGQGTVVPKSIKLYPNSVKKQPPGK